MMKLLLITAMLAMGMISHAATIYYTGPLGGAVDAAANWSGGVVPVRGTDVGIIGDGNNVVSSAGNLKDRDLVFNGSSSLFDAGLLQLNNTDITFNDTSSASILGGNFVLAKDGVTHLNWNSSGLLQTANTTLGGGNTSELGYLNQFAGSVTTADLTIKYTSVYTISGGSLSVAGDLDFRDGLEAGAGVNYMDFLTTGTIGTVSFVGVTADAQAFVDNGQMRLDGVAQTVGDYSGFSISEVGGITSVTVIPEPATLGMVAVFGGAILFILRRMK